MRGASFCDAVVHRCSDGRFHASRLLLATLSTTCTDAAEDSDPHILPHFKTHIFTISRKSAPVTPRTTAQSVALTDNLVGRAHDSYQRSIVTYNNYRRTWSWVRSPKVNPWIHIGCNAAARLRGCVSFLFFFVGYTPYKH